MKSLSPFRMALIAAVALAIAGAFVFGRATGGKADAPGAAASDPPSAPWKYVAGDASAPPWAPTRKWDIPMAGSIYRNRFAMPGWPLEGVESVLVTPLADECLDKCPLGLRIVGGEPGWTALRKLEPAIAPNLQAIEEAAGVPMGLAASLREVSGWLLARSESAQPAAGQPPLRSLFIAMPRPDVGSDAWSVGLAFYDLPDAHFDRPEDARGAAGGRRVLISRVEKPSAEGGRPMLICGALEVGHSGPGWALKAIPETPAELGRAFGTLWGHFGGLPQDVAGLYLAEDGRVYSYGANLELKPLPLNPELRRALEALLRRA